MPAAGFGHPRAPGGRHRGGFTGLCGCDVAVLLPDLDFPIRDNFPIRGATRWAADRLG
jgi:hypothetical protein